MRIVSRLVRAAAAEDWRRTSHRLAACGTEVQVTPPITITTPEQVSIGTASYIGPHGYLAGDGGLSIGTGVMIGPYVYVQTSTHVFEGDDLAALPYDHRIVRGPIVIGDYAWLGGRVTVLPGVTIGEGAVIGAGSLVTRDIPPLAIAAGSPARVIRYRDRATFERLLGTPTLTRGISPVWIDPD